MGDINLERALERLCSDKVSDRPKALEDVDRALKSIRGTSMISALADDVLHKIFEALFRYVRIEKPLYLRASTSKAETTAFSRLSSGASTLRLAVELANERVSYKTVNAVIDHIVDSLPTTNQSFCKPLAEQYLRSLRIILEHAPHTEHLRPAKWHDLVDFLLQGIADTYEDHDEDHTDSFGTPQPEPRGTNGRHMSVALTTRHPPRSSQSKKVNHAEDMIRSLCALVVHGNHPVYSKADTIGNGMLELLKHSSPGSNYHQPAFRILNQLMSILATENLEHLRLLVLSSFTIIRRLWNTKSALLREEMVVTLSYAEALVRFDNFGNEIGAFRESLADLFTVLYDEYVSRQEKDILQIDDIAFHSLDVSLGIQQGSVGPYLQNSTAITNWSLLSTMATILLHISDHHTGQARPPLDGEHQNKRRRTESPWDNVFHQLATGTHLARITSLQIIFFLLHKSKLAGKLYVEITSKLLTGIAVYRAEIASWIFLTCSSLSETSNALDPTFKEFWDQAWNTAARCTSTAGVSRMACHLLDTMISEKLTTENKTQRLLDYLFAGGLSGPPAISDTALKLFVSIMKSNRNDPIATREAKRDKILAWINATWHLSSSTDRISTSYLAKHSHPALLANALISCANRSAGFLVHAEKPLLTSQIQALYNLKRNEDLTHFLMKHVDEPQDHIENTQRSTRNPQPEFDGRAYDQLVIPLLQQKVRSFKDIWESATTQRTLSATPELFKVISSVCLTAQLVGQSLPSSQQTETLFEIANDLWKELCDFIKAQDSANMFKGRQTLIVTLASVDGPEDSDQQALRRGIVQLMKIDREILNSNVIDPLTSRVDPTDTISIDFDDSVPTDRSQGEEQVSPLEAKRSDDPFGTTRRSHISGLWLSLQLQYEMHFSDEPSQHLNDPQKVLALLINSDLGEMLIARNAISSALELCHTISRFDASVLLEKLGHICLQDYAWERNEAALCFCLEVMESLSSLWAIDADDDLYNNAYDLYSWFLQVGLGKGVVSDRVLVCLSRLLGKVLDINADFARDDSIPSPRTHLLILLQTGNNIVRYYSTPAVLGLFGHFVLKIHDDIFNDVIDHLPTDPDYLEGIALRLFVLTELACKWQTLLRRSIYHLFETPGLIPACMPHARQCINKICQALDIDRPQRVFQLFAPQVLYTWLQNQPVELVPFEIFKYETLQDLLRDVTEEIVAQTVMREDKVNLEQLSHHLETEPNILIQAAFSKVEAYCIARDIGLPRSQTENSRSVESSLKKQLGPAIFATLVQENFASIVATLILSTEPSNEFGKALQSHQDSQQAQTASQILQSLGSQSSTVTSSQQPCFRAKYVLDELAFVCRRGQIDIETMWSPALLVYVSRQLFDAALPALGPFHACGMLRRLRMVLALAGPTALSGYALEMLLHAVQPYLVNFHCSEEAVAVCRYLLTEGMPYLHSNPKFFGGFAVTSFASLLHFLDMKQDSTTQESHFKITLSKAQEFHNWLSSYATVYQSENTSVSLSTSFQKLLNAASNMRLNGVATRESYEGEVLMELLRDKQAGEMIVTTAASDAIFKLLSEAIQMPENLQDDILGDDKDALKHSPTLIQLLKRLKLSPPFRRWAAKAIGRAYAAFGDGSGFYGEQSSEAQLAVNRSESPRSSRLILIKLCSLLFNGSSLHSGIAERALQVIASNLNSQNDTENLSTGLDAYLLEAMIWDPYMPPLLPNHPSMTQTSAKFEKWNPEQSVDTWASNLATKLCLLSQNEPLLAYMPYILSQNKRLAVEIFPCVVHLSLTAWMENSDGWQRENLSRVFQNILQQELEEAKPLIRLILESLIYLRKQPIMGESTIADREKWLEIDFADAAKAAAFSQLHETALLFLEIHVSRTSKSSRGRRSSMLQTDDHIKSMHDIFENLNDPDFFYGIPQEPSLASIMSRLDFENNGFNSLSFQSASFDAQMRLDDSGDSQDASGLLKSLNAANLQGIAYNLRAKSEKTQQWTPRNDTQQMAISLRQWDLQPAQESGRSFTFEALRHVNQSESLSTVRIKLDDGLIQSLDFVLKSDTPRRFQENVADLASLTELNDIFSQTNAEGMEDMWQLLQSRTEWMHTESIDRSRLILTTREAAFSSISHIRYLSQSLNINPSQALRHEVQATKETLKISLAHEELQSALNAAAYLSFLSEKSKGSTGIDMTAAAQIDLARVLWKYGEMSSSIEILRQLVSRNDLQKQAIPVSRLEILADMGHYVAEARREKPEEIQNKYLLTAIREVKNSPSGTITGRVYHEFATFCDKQLQNPDDLDDYNRIEKLRTRKEKEVQDLEKMIAQADGRQRDALKVHRTKAKQWFELDDREYQRLKKIREGFLEKCLSNYLLALRACDDFENDVLRFVALWLDQSGNVIANAAVESSIKHVPSRKFAPLMNQLSSRLLDDKNDSFQRILFDLTVRICSDHPYHGMYQLFASSKSKGGRDAMALSRHAAANKITDKLRETRTAGPTWIAVHNASISFVRFAIDRFDDSKLKSGAKISLNKIPAGSRMQRELETATVKIPPPTMKISLRADCNYGSVPRLVRFEPYVSIAGGVSAPKIVTTIASDGSRHKQLFKGGNDDLRQDAIMEQVFEQVSNLLRDHRSTRLRNLGIRTYKVLPLTANAGIIEFVQDTIPLHDYLLPAHQRHFPKDMKPNQCRKHIADAQNRSVETRVSVFRQVTEHFQPVMRYFFMERFMNPLDWFQKRLAYSRSTAAISILGHVLGLGDRHGHNILLDNVTGEVVHIDLGVAFESGRVLPVPEVVPFRLTRDLVDGMGITGTEGVFRRCCNFTLEALRQDADSIMTILDVLRYDPLYSWSVSPLRMKRMQESQQAENAGATAQTNGESTMAGGVSTTRKDINEPSEADRALTVVAKKLGKSLSVEATVNELIQQATDERNLAVLYCGWAAYA